MAVQIIQDIPAGQTSTTRDLRSGDCFLIFFKATGQYWGGLPSPEIYLKIDEKSARVDAITRLSISPGWLFEGGISACYLHISNLTPGTHTVTIIEPEGGTLHRAFILRGTGGNLQLVRIGPNPNAFLPIAEFRRIWPNHPEDNTFRTSFPWTVSFPGQTALQLTSTYIHMVPPQGPINILDAWTILEDAPYGELIDKGEPDILGDDGGALNLQLTTNLAIMAPPAYTWGTAPNPYGWGYEVEVFCTIWLFYDTTERQYFWDDPPTPEDDGITGVTQIGCYIEAVADDDGSGGPNATSVTQAGSYVEAIDIFGNGGPNATGVTQIGGYIEGTSSDGPDATGVTQVGGYIEGTSSDGPDATSVTQIGAYIEAAVDPNYSATLVRISQAFVLVEARRVKKLPYLPDAGDIPNRLPEYKQAPPVPFNPLDLPEVATPTVSMQPLPQKGPVPFGPIQWISMPTPTVSMQPLPENAPSQQDYALPGSQSNILAITEARISRSMLVDALAATFDAQSTVVKGAAVGPNLALVNGIPAQTTETSPVAGRTATYTNIGRASMAIYAPEAQTPNAQKASSATDATPTIVSTPAKPITRINLIYPLLGSGSLASDLTIALDEIGYRKTIADVLDAIMQSTVTIGYEEGTAPETINLYVMPGAYDAATLDGLTVPELYLMGSAEAQILRYNGSVGQWRPASEPLDLKGLHLATNETPNQHGGFRYNPLTKHLEMLVEVT